MELNRTAFAAPGFDRRFHRRLHFGITGLRDCSERQAFRIFASRHLDRGISVLGAACLGVVEVGSLAVTLKLGDVPHIVQRETIFRIESAAAQADKRKESARR